jgi:ribose 5-phosphate isomerase B
MGTDSEDPVDYPSYCAAVGRAVARGDADRGIVLGGSGQGEQIAANKVHGVRAALCYDEHITRLAREHNDANVCSLGGRILDGDQACAIVDLFLATPFAGGRHVPRVEQIAVVEREECGDSG